MKQRLTLCLAVFTVMALSNVIVPVLPHFAEGAAMQGLLYAAYFIGALCMVLPGGVLCERFGRVPLIQAGLLLSLVSGVLMILLPGPMVILGARLLEGIGAGLFISSAMAWVNSQPDHGPLSGWFMASINAGLIAGLILTGLIPAQYSYNTIPGSFILFTVMIALALLLSAGVREVDCPLSPREPITGALRSHWWLYVSAFLLMGATGAVTALYPEFTDQSAELLGMQIALQNIGTIIAVLVASRFRLDPIPTIQAGSVILGLSVLLCYLTPVGFAVMGAAAGVVTIAQMAFLAETGAGQGVTMGLYNSATYAGMSILPTISGAVFQYMGSVPAFLVVAGMVGIVTITIRRCTGCSLKRVF
ncbi:MFS transporter [Methanosphaerula palustris]|uniref:Major facilitator superfamily MFS_1 n=1 Tax=Methanosphaerula palustris (strain ATCC BAA-1556 / DSM 19958 / E1-9c) TaxID=521011 RepID=B8GG64_METPE|nr:MFS transporter [Methanosphaerula palustris]ACL16138.1 major facilitator superfamily MFS_1 [Methanosphaerula palustris E1-9c]